MKCPRCNHLLEDVWLKKLGASLMGTTSGFARGGFARKAAELTVCPFCKHVLSNAWLKKVGSTLMGMASGPAKARTREVAQANARKRWTKKRKAKSDIPT